MANLVPQTTNEWMRWIEGRLRVQERRVTPAPVISPLQMKTPRYLARLAANFTAASNTLYIVDMNVLAPSPQHFDPDGLFEYKQLTPGGPHGIAVNEPGLYLVQFSVQWGGVLNAVNGGRKAYIHRHVDEIASFSSEDTAGASGIGNTSRATGVLALQAGEGVVTKVRSSANVGTGVITGPSASPSDPYASTSLSIVPIGAYNW